MGFDRLAAKFHRAARVATIQHNQAAIVRGFQDTMKVAFSTQGFGRWNGYSLDRTGDFKTSVTSGGNDFFLQVNPFSIELGSTLTYARFIGSDSYTRPFSPVWPTQELGEMVAGIITEEVINELRR